jgi:hypothetical protein
MKNMRKLILLFSIILGAGCSDWLNEPRPFGETDAEDLYRTEDGFKSVLIGAYINMSSTDLYGKNMSMLLPELFAQHWNVPIATTTGSQTAEGQIKRFNFENDGVKTVVSNTWKAYYNCIVNLNSLLGEIDAKKSLFSGDNYNLIKGEALGLRAFLHFELLRLFGPVPLDADPSRPAIPYVKKVSKTSEELLSIPYGKVLDEIIADLDEAETLLADDPVARFDRETLTDPSDSNTALIGDDFYYYRHNRFNLYAVKATKARYYLWRGNKVEALKYADEIINAVRTNGASKIFTLGDNSYILSSNDLLMGRELIFAVHKDKLGAIVEPLYKANGMLSQTSTAMTVAYENYGDDIRWKTERYWQNVPFAGGVTFMFKKYLSADYATAAKDVPVIRLSEMHFIAMECAATVDEAKQYFEPYMVARNLNFAWKDLLIDDHSILERLQREYRKDFMGEGQMFYLYKRHKVENFTWPDAFVMNPDNYVVPKPDKQTMFE